MSSSNGFSIALLAEGACLIVHEFKVSYFYCEKASIGGVPLPRTASPASGNRTVNSSCFENSVPSGRRVFGLCSNYGEWNVVTACLCKKGFTFGSKRCHSMWLYYISLYVHIFLLWFVLYVFAKRIFFFFFWAFCWKLGKKTKHKNAIIIF